MTTTDNFSMNQLFDLDAGKPHVRFDERGVETGLRLLRHASTLLKNSFQLRNFPAVGRTLIAKPIHCSLFNGKVIAFSSAS